LLGWTTSATSTGHATAGDSIAAASIEARIILMLPPPPQNVNAAWSATLA
jgi:hypothetical protein